MKKQLLLVSVLTLGLQGIAHATYPADAEASYNLPALESSKAWGVSARAGSDSPFPSGGGYIDD